MSESSGPGLGLTRVIRAGSESSGPGPSRPGRVRVIRAESESSGPGLGLTRVVRASLGRLGPLSGPVVEHRVGCHCKTL